MSNIDKIRIELERRIGSVNEEQDANPAMPKYRWNMYEGMKEAFLDMKYFIDSLPEEKPSEDLEEAAEEYTQRMLESWRFDSTGCRPPRECFKAGAEWQKEQMMKSAVEGYVNYYEDSGGILMAEAQVGCPYHNGDRVKIIIVKK